ncbi:MAG: hypothetical protein MI742_12095 [Desulfobacterales bacterium]|nr:hypothetical protein [Desulfobacterales bacterium]
MQQARCGLLAAIFFLLTSFTPQVWAKSIASRQATGPYNVTAWIMEVVIPCQKMYAAERLILMGKMRINGKIKTTSFKDENGAPLKRCSLKTGARVTITGRELVGGDIFATSVRKLPNK